MNFVYYLHDEPDQESFEKTLLWFKKRYNLISVNTLNEYLKGNLDLDNSCVLTVDDGWRSTYDVIFPVMRKYNIPFSVFVSPTTTLYEKNFWYYVLRYCNQTDLKHFLICNRYFSKDVSRFPIDLIFKELPISSIENILGNYLISHPEISVPRGFMNEKELLELHHSGIVEIGAHTMNHPILQNETDNSSRKEVIESVEKLSSILNYEVKTFAYPNGIYNLDFSLRELNYIQAAGIELAFSVENGIINKSTNPLCIPRLGSIARLKFGKLGQYLPSRANQKKIRIQIKQLKQNASV